MGNLDSMDTNQQMIVLKYLYNSTEKEASILFDREAQHSRKRLLGISNYNDLYSGGYLEKAACVIDVGLLSCNKAAEDAREAANSAQQLFPNSLHNGQGDAFRHCYWNARMVKSIGEWNATKVAGNHEAINGGPQAEKDMDLANNATGRSVGLQSADIGAAKNTCASMAWNGQLKTL